MAATAAAIGDLDLQKAARAATEARTGDSPKSRVQSPKDGFRSPKSEGRRPSSRVGGPRLTVRSPQFAVRNAFGGTIQRDKAQQSGIALNFGFGTLDFGLWTLDFPPPREPGAD